MSGNRSSTVEPLSLTRAEQWTLHHVLVDRLSRAGDDADGAVSEDERTTLRRAFERIDAGETAFTDVELRRLQAVLARYHHRTSWWEVERSQLEALLDRVSSALDAEDQTDSTGCDA